MLFHSAHRAASTLKCALALLLLLSLPARAVDLLRDADIEYALTQVASPVLQAAGLNPSRVKILVVDDSNMNAFVVSNDAIFLHSGLISRMERADMLQSVIAHEAAHIANGHITRRITNLGASRTAAGLGIALAAIAAAAGAGEAAGGIALGTQSAAVRSFLKHSRAEEASADQSALRYMRSAGVPATGMLDVMRLFRGQEALSESRQDPYVRSHPLNRDRVRAIESFANAQGAGPAPDPKSEYWFQRAKGKLTAFQRAPRWTLTRAGESGYRDLAEMRRAIAHHRKSDSRKALAALGKAMAARPNDPFLYDLQGEILMQARDFNGAVNAYARGVKLAPRNGLILSGYGGALLATGRVTEARTVLEQARAADFRDGIMLRDLAQAYARTGQNGMASLVTAERYALYGRLEDAGIHAKRASGLLAEGSGPWQRAQDVLLASERSARKRR